MSERCLTKTFIADHAGIRLDGSPPRFWVRGRRHRCLHRRRPRGDRVHARARGSHRRLRRHPLTATPGQATHPPGHRTPTRDPAMTEPNASPANVSTLASTLVPGAMVLFPDTDETDAIHAAATRPIGHIPAKRMRGNVVGAHAPPWIERDGSRRRVGRLHPRREPVHPRARGPAALRASG